MKILALDLGKFNSVGCSFATEGGKYGFSKLATTREGIKGLLEREQPERVVFESCSISGWVADEVRGWGVEPEVASTNSEAFRWSKVKRKNDRADALKLAGMAALGQISLVHVPERGIRQWRSLINYRQRLVQRRTRSKNRIRELLNREGLGLLRGQSAWSIEGRERLDQLARPLAEVGMEELWRGELEVELGELDRAEKVLRGVEEKLNQIGKQCPQVKLLQTIPGVGPRLAEAMVAWVDDPRRFRRGKEVGACLGLVPKQIQSGESNRLGKITRAGNGMLRALLVEVSWVGLRYNPWMQTVYQRAYRGSKARKKTAIVAVARRLAICCWAMLRDGQPWQPGRAAPQRG